MSFNSDSSQEPGNCPRSRQKDKETINKRNQNSILIQLPGSRLPYTFNPSYIAYFPPVVCTVSLKANICLDLYGGKEDGAIEDEPRWRILQEPRSLLITTGKLYTQYLHVGLIFNYIFVYSIRERQSLGAALGAKKCDSVLKIALKLRSPLTAFRLL